MIGDYEKILEKDKDSACALQDLQYCIIYNQPSHQKKPKPGKRKDKAGKQDEPYYDLEIHFHEDPPDYSSVTDIHKKDLKYSPYGIRSEDLPSYVPKPKGKYITLNHYFNANLMHDILFRKAVTGTIHLWNKTPMDWFSKKKSTSEISTYGYKFLSNLFQINH